MIKYNIPYRGSYQYEKFILNYLQLYNHINDLLANDSYNNIAQLEELQKFIDSIYDNCADLSFNILRQELNLNKIGLI